jgi:hypothetical protein
MAIFSPFSLICIAVALFLYALLPSKRSIPKYHEKGRPSVASALSYAQNPVDTIKRATEQCGNIFSLQIFTVCNIFLRGNELNKIYLDVREDTWSFGGGMVSQGSSGASNTVTNSTPWEGYFSQ